MGFSFTGETPALQKQTEGSATPSFSFLGGTDRLGEKRTAAGPSFGRGSTFGSASFGSATSGIASSTPSFNSTSPLGQIADSTTKNGPTIEAAEDTFLSRALARAATGRLTVFGRADKAADANLKHFFAQNNAIGSAALLGAQLKEVRHQFPELAGLLDYSFKQASYLKAGIQDEAKSSGSQGVSLPEVETNVWTKKTTKMKLGLQPTEPQATGKESTSIKKCCRVGRTAGILSVDEPHTVVDARQATDRGPKTIGDTADFSDEVDGTARAPPMVWSGPFRLLDLPPELRLWIYRHVLVPTGSISLRSCGHHYPTQVISGIDSTAILQVCQLVHCEAKPILYGENKVVANFKLEGGTTTTPILKEQLPDTALPDLTSLTLVVDLKSWWTRYAADMRQVQAMTGLKRLRFCVIVDSRGDEHEFDRWTWVMSEFAARVPATCQVAFGTSDEIEKRHVRLLAEDVRLKTVWAKHSQRNAREDMAELEDVSVLEEAWEKALTSVEKGSKSGSTTDWRWNRAKLGETMTKLQGEKGI